VSSLSSRDLSGIHDDSSQDEGGRRNKLLWKQHHIFYGEQ
jgi:hypothetical protein